MEWRENSKGQWMCNLGLNGRIYVYQGFLTRTWYLDYVTPIGEEYSQELSLLDAPDIESAQKIAYARYMLGVYK